MTPKPCLPKALPLNITTLQTIHPLKHRMSRDWYPPASCALTSCYPQKPWMGQLLLLPLQYLGPVLTWQQITRTNVLTLPQITRTHVLTWPWITRIHILTRPWVTRTHWPFQILPFLFCSPWIPADLLPQLLFTHPPFPWAQYMSQSVHRNGFRHECNHSSWHLLHIWDDDEPLMRHAGGYKHEQAMVCAMRKANKKKGHPDLWRAIKVIYIKHIGIITNPKCSPGSGHQNHCPLSEYN